MINSAIANRRSVRNFSDKHVSDEMIKEIIKAAQFSPSGMNSRSWEFIVVKDRLSKEKLCELTSTMFRQEAIGKASAVVIPVMNTEKSTVAVQDLSIVTGNIFTQVSEMGLGAFWKNVLRQEAEEIKKEFGIPEHFMMINIIPIGYPAEAVVPHMDSEFEENKIHWGKW
jgi:nitroreductase